MRRPSIRGPRAGLIASLVVALLAACGGPAATAAPSAEPSVEAVAIVTEPQPVDACMEALISGILVPHPGWGLALRAPNGELSRPIFPFGYSAARLADDIVLLDARGRLVARAGDRIESSGGSIGGERDPSVILCDGTIRVVPPG